MTSEHIYRESTRWTTIVIHEGCLATNYIDMIFFNLQDHYIDNTIKVASQYNVRFNACSMCGSDGELAMLTQLHVLLELVVFLHSTKHCSPSAMAVLLTQQASL